VELIFVIPVWLAFCGVAAYIASKKGRSGTGVFFLALLLSPLVGIIVALVMNPDPAAQGKKKCPACAEYVQPEAKICRFCQHAFAEDSTAPVVIAPTPVILSEEEIAAQKEAEKKANKREMIIMGSVLAVVVVVAIIALATSKPDLQSTATSASKSTSVPEPCCGNAARYREADEMSATMPKSRWNRRVATAIKRHCAVKGMSKEEVSEALGKATSVEAFQGSTDFGEVWTYQIVDKKHCVKYAGDTCSQFGENTERIEFSLKGFSTDRSIRYECVSLF
jgi:hypothetical protein